MNYLNEIFSHLFKLLQWWVVIMPWEKAVRVRFGKKVKILSSGIYLNIPLFDAVYVHTIRSRVLQMPPQTISTKDNKSLIITCSASYLIDDVFKLHNGLNQPEMTITNAILSYVCEKVSHIESSSITP